mgnify:CR=1 FL=1
MPKEPKIAWLAEPEEKDFPAAESYLLLIYDEPVVSGIISALRKASATQFKSKDIFRASGLSLLGISNHRVEKDRDKIKEGTPLSPILLVRDPARGRHLAEVHVLLVDAQHRDEAVGLEDVGAMLAVGCDLLQQPVAFPQVGAGVGL